MIRSTSLTLHLMMFSPLQVLTMQWASRGSDGCIAVLPSSSIFFLALVAWHEMERIGEQNVDRKRRCYGWLILWIGRHRQFVLVDVERFFVSRTSVGMLYLFFSHLLLLSANVEDLFIMSWIVKTGDCVLSATTFFIMHNIDIGFEEEETGWLVSGVI